MKWLICDFIAGCMGGACGILVGYPLDTIKTWQQASNARIGSAMFLIRERNDGIKGFYKGMFFPLITAGAINSILFGVYGNHLRQLQRICHSDYEREKYENQHIFAAGSIAGFVQSFIACPIELVKIRLQTHRYYNEDFRIKAMAPLKYIRKIVKTEGISGLYRGLLPMMCRDVLPYGIYMLVYQRTIKFIDNLEIVKAKREQNKSTRNTNLEAITTTIAGAFAGVMSWVLVIPFDVIKTIMQAEEPSNYKNMTHCIKTKIQRYGWKILFRGSLMLVFRAVPVNAATFLGYEYSLEKLQNNVRKMN